MILGAWASHLEKKLLMQYLINNNLEAQSNQSIRVAICAGSPVRHVYCSDV